MNRAPALGEIVRVYKAGSTPMIRKTENVNFAWQRNYYEHVMHDEQSFHRVRQDILDNPARWDIDRDNPQATTFEPKNAWKTNR